MYAAKVHFPHGHHFHFILRSNQSNSQCSGELISGFSLNNGNRIFPWISLKDNRCPPTPHYPQSKVIWLLEVKCLPRGSYHAVAETLLEKGGEVNAKDDEGQTAMHLAAWNGDTAVLEVLREGGADVVLQTDYGNTPLHTAASLGHLLFSYTRDARVGCNREGKDQIAKRDPSAEARGNTRGCEPQLFQTKREKVAGFVQMKMERDEQFCLLPKCISSFLKVILFVKMRLLVGLAIPFALPVMPCSSPQAFRTETSLQCCLLLQEEQGHERSRMETEVTNLQTENSELKDILCLREREIRELKEQHTADVGNGTNRSEGEDAKEQHLEEVRNLRRMFQRTREEEVAEERRELSQMLRNREEKIESLKVGLRRCTQHI
ncbi:uncharacterized protein LOC122264606 [Penaeus japonicus]|uniref:uncharacterized protein LOC122264606 n=1 Tax=Penaeus japonicus TaxID=27405 RepID=UPI001C716ABB|nr:uncharacterized protein LOC122264606 [Penaeus japonicus]